MIFSRLFRRNKNQNKEEEYNQSAYASLQTDNIVQELGLSGTDQAKNYVVDLCEQMISTSKELEDARAEYQLVTDYLNDIQIIEELTEAEKKPIAECAMHVAKLEKQRTEFLKVEHKLTDTQYAQMQEEEDNLPGVIRRLKSNEAYLDAIKKDLAYLEGKKLEWAMQREEAVRTQKNVSRAGRFLLVAFATLTIFFLVLSGYLQKDMQLFMMITAFVAVAMGTYILVKLQDALHDMKKSDVNRNHAISLENHAKIKYVNIKNAVDFTCEKYHVHNSYELEFLYEKYQEEARERETYRKTSDDLDYYSKSLVQYLERLRMYDAKAWINHANAIVDSRELVELKHDLITRRQKLRARMEYSMNSISQMKQEAYRNINQLGNNRYQIEQIIRKIEAMNPSL